MATKFRIWNINSHLRKFGTYTISLKYKFQTKTFRQNILISIIVEEIQVSYAHVLALRMRQLRRGKVKVTGRGGPYGCETLRFPRLLDNWLTDGSKVVSLTRRPPFTPQEDSWY
jgi:hypothetical protein